MLSRMCIRIHVKQQLFLLDFIRLEISWQIFEKEKKILKYQILWKSIQLEPSCFTRTDRHDWAKSRSSKFCERAYKLMYDCALMLCMLWDLIVKMAGDDEISKIFIIFFPSSWEKCRDVRPLRALRLCITSFTMFNHSRNCNETRCKVYKIWSGSGIMPFQFKRNQ